jgi:hypothetical protein
MVMAVFRYSGIPTAIADEVRDTRHSDAARKGPSYALHVSLLLIDAPNDT